MFLQADQKKQDCRPILWLAETFSTSSLKPGRSETRWPPRPLIGGDIFNFSSKTTEQISMKAGRKQDLNVLYQVCVFQADQKTKMAAQASDWLRHFRLLFWNRWTKFKKTSLEARSQCPLQSFFFHTGERNKMVNLANPSKSCTLYLGARYVALWAPCLYIQMIDIHIVNLYSTNFILIRLMWYSIYHFCMC